MAVFFKLVNHDNWRTHGEVSHYFAGPPFLPTWPATPAGGTLHVICNADQVESMNAMPVGADLVLFQSIKPPGLHAVSQIVTHWLKVGDAAVAPNHLGLAAWPFARECRIHRILAAGQFGGHAVLPHGSLVAGHVQAGFVRLPQLFGVAAGHDTVVRRGRAYDHWGAHFVTVGQLQAKLTLANGFV